MDLLEGIKRHAQEHGLVYQDSLQTFMQVLVLKNLSLQKAHLMGGAALVFGYNNPRFSEDIDLTQVSHPRYLEKSLKKASGELEGWFSARTKLTPPKPGGSTWRLTCAFNPSEVVRLHVDSQSYPAHSTQVIIVRFLNLIPPFVCSSLSLVEIMAEKIIALGFRHYLSGRDLFDLWFHWLSRGDAQKFFSEIQILLNQKLKDRGLKKKN